ncbi:MAG TPA: hypothetical protein VF528_13395 [Pyrinomonadaceae bacterium]|jgi:hypothetical protein
MRLALHVTCALLALIVALASCSQPTTQGNNVKAQFTPSQANQANEPNVADTDSINDSNLQTKLRSLPEIIRGVTLQDVQRVADANDKEQKKYNDMLSQIVYALQHHSDKKPSDTSIWPMARIVFDLVDDKLPTDDTHQRNYLNADNYLDLVTKLHNESARSFVMGQIMDSQALEKCSAKCYEQRTSHYLDKLGDFVDVWEVGNEVNGEWAGEIPDVVEKIKIANKLVKDKEGRTALTLFYNTPCHPSANNEMFKWVNDHHEELLKMKFNYILISYWEDEKDCPGFDGPQPDWGDVFRKLGSLFPDTKIGFGECGSRKRKNQIKYIDRYYRIVHPQVLRALPENIKRNYIGGYFWWYYREDMVPWKDGRNKLWKALDSAFQSW